MATYKFEEFNVEIIDPTVTVNPIVKEINPVLMTITVDVTLTTVSTTFGIELKDVKVLNLNYDSDSLTDRVLERLKDFEVIA